jgi:hypothetical protein
MFDKSARTRVTEIVDYLCAEVPGPEKPGVRAFLNQHAVMATAMSDQYSSKLVQNPGNANERAMRRAILFLDSLNGASAADLQQLRNIATAQLRTQLDRRLLGLRYAADQEQGGTGLLGFVFNNKFKPDAMNFLANNNVFVYGSNTSGVVNCFLEYVWQYRQFKIIPPPSGKAHSYALKAVNVPAVSWDSVPNRPAPGSSFADIAGTELTGADLLISTQFTGCAFCFKEVGGRLFAAHIMPDNGPAGAIAGSGIELARQLAGQTAGVTGGDFANARGAGTLHVYGRGYSNIGTHPPGYVYTGPPSSMTIIGIRRGNWQIYSQEVSATKQLSVYQIL